MATRVIMFVSDDQRFDDFYARMNAGPRSGELCMQQVTDRLINLGQVFYRARGDMSFCQPARAAMFTGLTRPNHGISDVSTTAYYNYFRTGMRAARVWSGVNQWQGPFEFDLAKKAGLADTPVVASSQPYVGQASNIRTGWDATNGIYTQAGRGDGTVSTAVDDDLQARTGSVVNWLSENGITVFGSGKYMNGWGNTTGTASSTFGTQDGTGTLTHAKVQRFVPPGWSHIKFIYPGDDQDHYDLTTCDFTGTNPGDGDGQVGTNSSYTYAHAVASASWSAGTATITLTAAIDSTNGGPLQVGDEIALDGFVPTAWNRGVATLTSVSADNKTFTFAATNPGTATTIGSFYPRPLHSEQIFVTDFLDYMATLSDGTDFLGYYGTRMPHGTPTNQGGDATQNEKRYENTVDGITVGTSEPYRWLGVAGQHSPAMTTSSTESGNAAHLKNWRQRQAMLATCDDIVGQILDYCDGRWGVDGYTFIYVSDNGYQDGEHSDTEGSDVWSPTGAKVFIWEGSLRSPLIIRGPRFPLWEWYGNIQLADIALTLLDLFGLTTHHAHTKRDGRSILRELENPTDRSILATGKYLQNTWTGLSPTSNTNQGIVNQEGWKLVRRWDDPSARELFDAFDYTEFETVNHEFDNTTTQTLADTLAGKCDRAMTARWDAVNNRHTKDDINGYAPATVVTGTAAGSSTTAGAATGRQLTAHAGLAQGISTMAGAGAGLTAKVGSMAGLSTMVGDVVIPAVPGPMAILDADKFAVLD